MDSIILIILTAGFTENALFARAYGQNQYKDAPVMSAREALNDSVRAVLPIMAGAFSGWFGSMITFGSMTVLYYLRPAISLFIYILLYFLIIRIYNLLFEFDIDIKDIVDSHALIAFGYIPIGTMLAVSMSTYSLAEAAVFGTGTVLGYIFAAQVTAGINRKLALASPPKILEGFPVQFIYFGIIAIALYGLSGHLLPA